MQYEYLIRILEILLLFFPFQLKTYNRVTSYVMNYPFFISIVRTPIARGVYLRIAQ